MKGELTGTTFAFTFNLTSKGTGHKFVNNKSCEISLCVHVSRYLFFSFGQNLE